MYKKNAFTRIIGLLILIFLIIPTSLLANSDNKQYTPGDTISYPLNKYLYIKLNMDVIPAKFDTISVLYTKHIGVLDYLNDESVPIRYISPDPNYYRLTVPLVYYNSPATRFGMEDLPPYFNFDKSTIWKDSLLSFNKEAYTSVNRINKLVDRALMDMYLVDVSAARTSEEVIMGHEVYIDELNKKDRMAKKKTSGFFKADEEIFSDLTMVESKIKKPNWWHSGGEGSLQITQNYISPNWYKGGETNNSVLGDFKLFFNYNDKNKIQIENLLEAKLGFNTVPSDTLRSYRVNTDLIRLSTKVGIKASKSNWFYTISGEVNTQFSRNFKKNSEELMSSFMTPFNLILNLGMDFKANGSKANFSLLLSPVSYNFRYLKNPNVNPKNFGMEEGKRIMHDVGSKIDTKLEWKIISSIRLTSQLNYFTNYSKVVAEWENTFDFVLNRYLSTKIFFHARFDDAAKKIDNHSYLQFKELLSFGINYKW